MYGKVSTSEVTGVMLTENENDDSSSSSVIFKFKQQDQQSTQRTTKKHPIIQAAITSAHLRSLSKPCQSHLSHRGKTLKDIKSVSEQSSMRTHAIDEGCHSDLEARCFLRFVGTETIAGGIVGLLWHSKGCYK